MKKKFLSILLSLAMCLSLLPTAALAATTSVPAKTNLANYSFNATHDGDISDLGSGTFAEPSPGSGNKWYTAGSGAVYYIDAETKLVLVNATIETTNTYAFNLSDRGFTVELQGENTLIGGTLSHSCGALHSSGTLTVNGTQGASLNCSSIDAGTLTINGGSYQIQNSAGNCLAADSGSITIRNAAMSLVASNSGNAVFAVTGGSLNVSNSTLHVKANEGATVPGSSLSSMTISDGSTVNISVENSSSPDSAILTVSRPINIMSGSTLNLSGGTVKVESTGSITLDADSTVSVAADMQLADIDSISNNAGGTFRNNGTVTFTNVPASTAIAGMNLSGAGCVKLGSGYYSISGDTELKTVGTLGGDGKYVLNLTGDPGSGVLDTNGYSWDALGSTPYLLLGDIYVDKIVLPSRPNINITAASNASPVVGSIDGSQLSDGYTLNISTCGGDSTTETNTFLLRDGLTLPSSSKGNTTIKINRYSEFVCGTIDNRYLDSTHTLTIMGDDDAESIDDHRLTVTAGSSIDVGSGSLTIKNLTADIARINTAAGYGNLTLDNAKVRANYIFWYDSDGYDDNGIFLTNSELSVTGDGERTSIFSGNIRLLDNDSVLRISGGHLSNYGNITGGLDGLRSLLPTGYSISSTKGEFNYYPYHIQGYTIVDPTGVPATDLTLQYRAPAPSTPSVTRYTITATAGEGGTISPSGSVRVARGNDKTFTVTASEGYRVSDVLVDGESVGAVERYTFENVRAKHTISASFVRSNAPSGLNSTDHVAYVGGYPDGRFGGEDSITRAQTATMLYRLLTPERRAEIETDAHRFTDIPEAAWYRTEVATMANGGYLNGYTDGRFGGEDAITRAEFVTVLARFIELEQLSCSFTDVERSHWAYGYIANAEDAGWITGADGSFRPDDAITRAEAVTIINRVLERGVDENSTLLGFKSFPDNTSDRWYYYEVIEAANGHDYTGSRPSESWTKLK